MKKIIISGITIATILALLYSITSKSSPDSIQINDITILSNPELQIEDAKYQMKTEIVKKCRALPTDGLMESDAMKSAISMMVNLTHSPSDRQLYTKNIASSVTCRRTLPR